MFAVFDLTYNDYVLDKKDIVKFNTMEDARNYCFEQIYDLYVEEVWPYLEDDDKSYDDPKQQLQSDGRMFHQSKSWDASGKNSLYSYMDFTIDWGKILVIIDDDASKEKVKHL